MAIETSENVAIGTAWTPIAVALSTVSASLVSGSEVVIAIGSAPPPADSVRGHPVRPEALRDTFATSGVITTETVYARTRQGAAVLAVTKG